MMMRAARHDSSRGAGALWRRRTLLTATVIGALLVLPAPWLAGSAQAAGGVAATAHPLATEAALAMLDRGGNAVDAAVAAAFVLGVVEPHASGLGGGGGMLIHLRERGETVYLNYYHQAPGDPAACGFDRSRHGATARAVIVPGTAAGLCRALADYGTLPLPVVIAPAIRHAEEGHPIDRIPAGLVLDNMNDFAARPGFAEVFLSEGFPLLQGELLRQPELARVLRLIAEHGADGFYRGQFAEQLVRELAAQGGCLTLADLAAYEPTLSEPVRGSYRGLEIVSAPPPHGGVALVQSLHMIEMIDLDPAVHFTASAAVMHLIAEVFRRAYADRSQFVGDPRFTDVPVAGLVSRGYARERFNEINPYRVQPRNYRDTPAGAPLKYMREQPAIPAAAAPADRRLRWTDEVDEDPRLDNRFQTDPFDRWRRGRAVDAPPPRSARPDTVPAFSRPFADDDESSSTTHLSVIDADGNMVSLTQTLGVFFGSRVMVGGVILNDGRRNFSDLVPSNLIGPGRRPRSTITPTLVFRAGQPFLALGSPGAGRIPAAIAQVIMNVVDYGMDVQTANAAARFFCQKFEDHLFVESRVGQDVRQALTRLGHSVRVLGEMDLFFGGVSIAAVDPADGALVGSADPRRSGDAGSLQPHSLEADSD